MSLSSAPPTEKQIHKSWKELGDLTITIPQPVETASRKPKSSFSILEDKIYAPLATAPQVLTNIDWNELYVKTQISRNIVSANKKNLIKRDLDLTEIFTPLQKEIFSIINNYQDLYYSGRTFSNAEEIRFVYCLHVVNHMLKTRTKILHHNAKLSKRNEVPDDYRDQGLVRPKVDILIIYVGYRSHQGAVVVSISKEDAMDSITNVY